MGAGVAGASAEHVPNDDVVFAKLGRARAAAQCDRPAPMAVRCRLCLDVLLVVGAPSSRVLKDSRPVSPCTSTTRTSGPDGTPRMP